MNPKDMPPLPPGAIAGVTHFLRDDILSDYGWWMPIKDFVFVEAERINSAFEKLKPYQKDIPEGMLLFEALVEKFIEHKTSEKRMGAGIAASEAKIRSLETLLERSEELRATSEAQQRANWLADVLMVGRELLRDTERKLREVRADRDELRDELAGRRKQ